MRRRVFAWLRNPVLLDNEPSRVAVEVTEEPVEIDVAGAELAEDARGPRLVPARRAAEDVEADILQVHVVHTLAPGSQRRHGIAACRHEVAGVEQEPDIRALEQPLDLRRR